MVQILPQEDSLGALLGRGFGAGIQQFSESLRSQREMNQLLGMIEKKQPSDTSLQAEQTSGGSPQASQMTNIEKIASNPTAMMLLANKNPKVANQIQTMYENQLKQKELAQKHEYEQQKLASAESKKYKERIEELQPTITEKEISLERIKDALSSNDLKGVRNFIADAMESKGLPGEYIRKSSATALNSAVKEFFLNDIARIKGGRPNQFIEKQLSASYPKAGYDPKANEKIFLSMQAGVDLLKKEGEIYNKISNEYESKGKFVPGNIAKLVNQELKPFAEEIEKKLIEQYKEINQRKEG